MQLKNGKNITLTVSCTCTELSIHWLATFTPFFRQSDASFPSRSWKWKMVKILCLLWAAPVRSYPYTGWPPSPLSSGSQTHASRHAAENGKNIMLTVSCTCTELSIHWLATFTPFFRQSYPRFQLHSWKMAMGMLHQPYVSKHFEQNK